MKDRDLDTVAAYRLYQRMMRYPELFREMRSTFLKALEERGVIDSAALEAEAARRAKDRYGEVGETLLQEYRGALVDLYFANHFTDAEIESHINLARKKNRFRELFRVVNADGAGFETIRKALKDFCDIPQGEMYISPNEAEGVRVALINHFISDQLPFISIAKNHITIRDMEEMLEHTYWNPRRKGKIGGKAAGLLLAHKILLPRLSSRDEELEKHIRIPESHYFHSGIFSDFLDYNELGHLHAQKYKSREEIEEDYRHVIAPVFQRASFPPDVVDRFRDFLDRTGEHPLVLRSSSLLEDNFGHSFSGKYDSVFVANQGDLEARLDEFVRGLKLVHMSTFGPSPILYRRDHHLIDFDEKMGVLVQKVAGRRFGDYFFPLAAGVAFSHNSYIWTPRIRREDGAVRCVFGLGTRAVDRVADDYPRIIPLSHPQLRPEAGAERICGYSQNMVDVINLRTRRLQSVPCAELLETTSHPDLHLVVSVKEDGHLSPPLFKTARIDPRKTCITFDNFIKKTPFAPLMKKVLDKLEEAYGRPVDVEFAWDENRLYIVQCRSLSVNPDAGIVSIPSDIAEEKLLFKTRRVVAGCAVNDIELVVYVNPRAYAALESYEEKAMVGRVVSRLNTLLEAKRYALLGPGRWGGNNIDLGVRVSYGDINRTLLLGEIAFEAGGSTPDVSYGTHFFNDLVEARIVPVAIFPDEEEGLFREDLLLEAPDELADLLPGDARWNRVVRVVHCPRAFGGDLLHVLQDGAEQRGVGFLGPPRAGKD